MYIGETDMNKSLYDKELNPRKSYDIPMRSH